MLAPIAQNQSFSVNDENGRINNEKDDKRKKLHKSLSHHNYNSKRTIVNYDRLNKTASTGNVFSRLMHSEPHVQTKNISNG